MFANPVELNSFNSINSGQWLDHQTTEANDDQWLFTDSSGSASKDPSVGTNTEPNSKISLTDDHEASSLDDTRDVPALSNSAQSPPVVNPDSNPVDRSDSLIIANCNSKRDVAVEDHRACPNPQSPPLVKPNFPKNRKNAVIRRPAKVKTQDRPPWPSAEYEPCKEKSAELELEIEYSLFRVTCGGPLVGDEYEPEVVFNCVLGN